MLPSTVARVTLAVTPAPMPEGARQRREELDIHAVDSQLVSPYLAMGVYDRRPKSEPNTDTSTEPDDGEFVLNTELSIGALYETADVRLPSSVEMLTLAVAHLPAPPGTRHRIDESDTQNVASQLVLP